MRPPLWISRALLAAAALVAACRRDDALQPVAAVEDPTPAMSALDRADLLRRELSAGRVPGGVETTLADLQSEALAARSDEERTRRELAAADLVAARYRLRRSEADLTRAEALYASVSRGDGPEVCTALTRASELSSLSGDARRAMNARQILQARCPSAVVDRPTPAPPPPRDAGLAEPRASVRRVVLDPGHGGQDPGAIGPTGLTEASVNLDVTRRLADRLSSTYGVQVVLTRDSDVYVELEDRAAQANASGADLFVSIHCNAANNAEAHGISTFVLETTSDRVNARVLAREGELVSFDPAGAGDLPRILADMRLTSQGSLSFALASRMQEAMLHDARLFHDDVADLGVHPARFQVLVTARMPAVLVELSFISNATEEQRLRSSAYRDVLASALARTIARGGT